VAARAWRRIEIDERAGVAAWNRRLVVRMLLHTFEDAMRTTAMIMAILIAPYFLNFVIKSIGLTVQVYRLLTGLGPYLDGTSPSG
jgi:TRAP-type C4-dicarboxylate transport system permease large subunit